MNRLLSIFRRNGGNDGGNGRADGCAGFAVAMDAIATAQILARMPDEETGARTFVISKTLRGSFLFSRDEATRRILIEFPSLSDAEVRKVVNALDARVRMHLIPPPTERTNYVNSWRN